MLHAGTKFTTANNIRRAMITTLIKALIRMPRLARTAWKFRKNIFGLLKITEPSKLTRSLSTVVALCKICCLSVLEHSRQL